MRAVGSACVAHVLFVYAVSYFIIQLPSTNAIGTTISSFVLSLKHSTRKA